MEKTLTEQLAELKTALEASTDVKMKAELALQIKAVQDAAAVETKAAIQVVKDESEKKYDELKAEFKEMQKKSARIGGMGGSVKSFSDKIGEKLEENKADLKAAKKFSFDIESKAVGDMGSATNLTGSYFVPADVKPGVVVKPYEDIHMRNLLITGSTSSNVIRHIRDNGGEGGPTTVAEAGTKPKMDRDLSIEDANVRKIATYLRVPEEMMEDIPYLSSFLSNRGTEEVMKLEDTQVLYGDGTGQNLSGLFTNATAFAAGTAIVTTPNRFDVLRAARLQMRKLFRKPSYYLVSPLDYFLMTSVKDTTNNYMLLGGGNGLVPTLDGVPVIESTSITDGDFLAMDKLSAELDFRSNISVRFYEQDQDNAIKNMVTIVIEERAALPIYYVSGLVKGTFATAITDLTS
jgi:HK97 family phage major capsid protein